MCLKIKQLDLYNVADLDGVNEEIELQISTSNNIVDCGIYCFNQNNSLTSAMNISVPCKAKEAFNITFIERDVCNDDYKNITIMCAVTNNTQQVQVDISTSNNYTTSHDYALKIVDNFRGCSGLAGDRTPQIGGAFCDQYKWGTFECGTIGKETKTSKYTLQYEITSENCEIFWDYNSICYLEPFIQGVDCNDPFTENSNWVSISLMLIVVANFLG